MEESKCPEGFRCGPCVAADKARVEHPAVLAEQCAWTEGTLNFPSRCPLPAGPDPHFCPTHDKQRRAQAEDIRRHMDNALGGTARMERRYTREEVLLVAGAGIADGAAGVSRALASLDGLR